MKDGLKTKINKDSKLNRIYIAFSILFVTAFCINTFITIYHPSSWKEKLEKSSTTNSSIQINSQYIAPNNKQEIAFSNKNFEMAIRDLLNKKTGAIYNTDLEPIEVLNLCNYNIDSVEDLKYFVSLKTLDLSRNKIKYLTGIENLKNLEELNLYENCVVSIEPLGNLNPLKKVDLSNNNISDITPLSKLYNLESVDLSFNEITDISPVLGLDKLNELDISKNNIKDKDDIKKLNYVGQLFDWGN